MHNSRGTRGNERRGREVERADVAERTTGQAEVGTRETEFDDVRQILPARLACVSMTPLGRPVVPDVYINRCTSSPAAATRATALASARRSPRNTHPRSSTGDRLTRTSAFSRPRVASLASWSRDASQTKARAPECSRM